MGPVRLSFSNDQVSGRWRRLTQMQSKNPGASQPFSPFLCDVEFPCLVNYQVLTSTTLNISLPSYCPAPDDRRIFATRMLYRGKTPAVSQVRDGLYRGNRDIIISSETKHRSQMWFVGATVRRAKTSHRQQKRISLSLQQSPRWIRSTCAFTWRQPFLQLNGSLSE